MTRKDMSTGVIVFRRNGNGMEYLLIKHGKGHWAFPKGHMDKGETKLEAALRELYEETGIRDIDLISNEIMINESYTFTHDGNTIEKTVEYFIGECNNGNSAEVKIDGDEIIDYKWCSREQSKELLTYEQTKELLIKAENIIKNKISVKSYEKY